MEGFRGKANRLHISAVISALRDVFNSSSSVTVLNTIGQKFWLVTIKPLIKSYIKTFVTDKRFTCTEAFYVLSDVPAENSSIIGALNYIRFEITGFF